MLKWINDDCLKVLAIILVGVALLMFAVPLMAHDWCTPLDLQAYGTFVGGTAGPMAALAGFLFIYLTFQHQQNQLNKHDEQFKLQSFETTFFNLLNFYRDMSPSFSIAMNSKNMSVEEFKKCIDAEIGLVTPQLKINTVAISVEDLRTCLHARFSKQEKQLQHLIKPLLSIVEHILQYNNDDYTEVREKYFSILVSQIPDDFLYVYFYMYIAECNSSTSWSYRRKMYHLLRLIDDEILVIPEHKKWLEKAPFRAEHPLLDNNLPSYDF